MKQIEAAIHLTSDVDNGEERPRSFVRAVCHLPEEFPAPGMDVIHSAARTTCQGDHRARTLLARNRDIRPPRFQAFRHCCKTRGRRGLPMAAYLAAVTANDKPERPPVPGTDLEHGQNFSMRKNCRGPVAAGRKGEGNEEEYMPLIQDNITTIWYASLRIRMENGAMPMKDGEADSGVQRARYIGCDGLYITPEAAGGKAGSSGLAEP